MKGELNQFRIECSEVNYFTILVEAETEEQARELANANINSFDIEDEYTSEWSIENVQELWNQLRNWHKITPQRGDFFVL